MDEQTKQVVYNGFVDFSAQGKEYSIKPLSLKYVISGEFEKSKLIAPLDKQFPGKMQIYNLIDEERRKALDVWLSDYLVYDGEPASLELISEHGWDVIDLGRFIGEFAQSSG